MNNYNLINLKDRTQEERQAIARKGNKASIYTRRISKYFKLKQKHKRVKADLETAIEEYINKYAYYCKDFNDILLTLRLSEYRHYRSLKNKVKLIEEEIDKTAKQIIEEYISRLQHKK